MARGILNERRGLFLRGSNILSIVIVLLEASDLFIESTERDSA